jgi:hypothetical protein
MPREIKQKYIKTTFKFEVENPIELGSDIKFEVDANCVKIETLDNQDGTINVVYVLKPLSVEVKQ